MTETRSLFSCEAGISRFTYDWDGKKYGCHLLSPLALSNQQLTELSASMKAPRPVFSPCHSCDLDALCPSCEGNNIRLNGNPWLREEKNCKLFRHQLYYAYVFQMKRILKKDEWGEDRPHRCPPCSSSELLYSVLGRIIDPGNVWYDVTQGTCSFLL